jgi:hypothetical protein
MHHFDLKISMKGRKERKRKGEREEKRKTFRG